jgi:hypothetical protein
MPGFRPARLARHDLSVGESLSPTATVQVDPISTYGEGQGFHPSRQKRGMGIRQDGKFDLGRITRFLEEYRSSADLKSCQSCAAERQSIQSQCVGSFCREIPASARRLLGKFWEPTEDLRKRGRRG